MDQLIKEREIDFDQIPDTIAEFDSVVLTVYMTSKKDPQRQLYQESNSYDYIKPWYETMITQQLHGIIFHDNLSTEFVNKYQTDKIFFIKSQIGDYSINDERYILYYHFLKRYSHYKWILTTDVSDVEINKNPFEFMQNDPSLIYVGTNVIGMGAIKRTPAWYDRREWKINKFNTAIEKAGYDPIGYQKNQYQIYNAGLLGGETTVFTPFLKELTLLIFITDNQKNNNMLLLNYLIVKNHIDGYNPDTFCTNTIFTGPPFNSIYKKYEKLNKSPNYLIHK